MLSEITPFKCLCSSRTVTAGPRLLHTARAIRSRNVSVAFSFIFCVFSEIVACKIYMNIYAYMKNNNIYNSI